MKRLLLLLAFLFPLPAFAQIGAGIASSNDNVAAAIIAGQTNFTCSTASGIAWNNAGSLACGPNTTTTTGSMVLGGPAVDTAPVAQTLSVQNTLAGGTSNVAGANFTIAGSQGKGSSPGGSLVFQVAPAGAGGTTVNPLSTVLTMDSTLLSAFGGSVTVPNAKGFIITTGFGIFNNTGTTADIRTTNNSTFASLRADAFTAASTVATAAPTGSSAGLWKLGALQSGAVVLDTTRSIFVDIGGTGYKLMVAQ